MRLCPVRWRRESKVDTPAARDCFAQIEWHKSQSAEEGCRRGVSYGPPEGVDLWIEFLIQKTAAGEKSDASATGTERERERESLAELGEGVKMQEIAITNPLGPCFRRFYLSG
jgi:hypothetical protein